MNCMIIKYRNTTLLFKNVLYGSDNLTHEAQNLCP